MFRKKFKLRVYSSSYNDNCYYVQYTYYCIIPNWHNIHYNLHGSNNVYRIFTDFGNAEEFAKKFDSIEKVVDYNKKLEELIAYGKTKMIYSK